MTPFRSFGRLSILSRLPSRVPMVKRTKLKLSATPLSSGRPPLKIDWALSPSRETEKNFDSPLASHSICVFSLLSGYFVHDKIDSSGQEVQALREKLNMALEERDKTTKSMSDLKSQFQTLQGENAKLAETEKILQSQLASSANAPSANSGLMREQLAAANKALQEERENSKAIAADLDNAKSRIIVLEQESNKSKENTVSNTVSLPVDYKDNLDNDRKKPFKLPDGKWSLEKKARCKLSFSGHDYIDGPCYYRSTPDRKWSIRAVGASKPHKAYWQVESGTAERVLERRGRRVERDHRIARERSKRQGLLGKQELPGLYLLERPLVGSDDALIRPDVPHQ